MISDAPEPRMGHGIVEWFGLEGTLRIILFQPSCRGQGTFPGLAAESLRSAPGMGHPQLARFWEQQGKLCSVLHVFNRWTRPLFR